MSAAIDRLEVEEKEEGKKNECSNPPTVLKENIKPSPIFLYSDSPLLAEKLRDALTIEEEKTGQQLLDYVANGEQDEAEGLIKGNSRLLLFKGNVTDPSGRSFEGVTAFQYAFWALDWHMWTMLLEYEPEDNGAPRKQWAALQCKEFPSKVAAKYGAHANWKNLIDSYSYYSSLIKQGLWEKAAIAWREGIGGAQQSVPAHVANEALHPNRPFALVYYFKDIQESKLPRYRINKELDWYNPECGKEWAHYRWELEEPIRVALKHGARFAGLEEDQLAFKALLEKRQQQAAELENELEAILNPAVTSQLQAS